MRIAYIGNHGAEFSTESDIRRTLERMGHEVVKVQENQWKGDLDLGGIDLLLWTHTQGWCDAELVGDVLDRCKRASVPTVGLHLDLWRGLPRTANIGRHPFFRVGHLFTADGGDPEFWRERGVNHRWSPPGVLESSCYLAEPDPDQHPQPIIFVGAKGYHPEYAFRGKLLEWLAATYGDRYRLYEHSSAMRGHRLNVLYASAKVVVGDSCFAGAMPNYWSDRLPETLGRGGRLVFPRIEGLPEDTPCRLFEPGNLDDLKAKIEDALGTPYLEAFQERERAVAWTAAGHTYRHRLEAMFSTLRADGVLR